MPESLIEQLFDLQGFEHAGFLCEAGTPWETLKKLPDYLHTLTGAGGRIEGQVHRTAVLQGPVAVGPGTIVGPHSVVVGPTVIGANCFIGASSLIRSALVGTGTLVGYSNEVARSVLMNGVRIPHHSLVLDSVLSNRVHLGGGTLTANVKLNGREVVATVGGQRYPTGLRKFGAVIADDSNLGAVCILMPGAVLGKGCTAFPGVHLWGWYPPDCRVKLVQSQQVLDAAGHVLFE